MDIQPVKNDTLTKPVPPIVSDTAHAPFLYFEEAPNFGCGNGVINITLANYRNLPGENGTIKTDVVVVGYLRCNVQAALTLKAAIEGALLLAAPVEGQAN